MNAGGTKTGGTKMRGTYLQRFFLGVLVAAGLSIGCTTTQSPRRQVDDLRITAEVKSKLAGDVMPSSLVNIKVNTTNGVVSLAGQVESEDVKHRAETTALHVAGVIGVNNNLQIEPAPAVGLHNGGS
jgi:osmotically-inducible protein OsmY